MNKSINENSHSQLICDCVTEAKDVLLAKSAGKHPESLKSGFKNIDAILNDGLILGEVSLLYGESHVGKTDLGLSVALNNVLIGNGRINYITTKDTPLCITHRAIANVCGINYERLCRGVLKDEEWENFDMLIDRLLNSRLYIENCRYTSAIDIMEIIQQQACNGTRLFIIDDIQHIHSNGTAIRFDDRELSYTMRQLKQTAKMLHVHIIVISRLHYQKNLCYSKDMPVSVLVDECPTYDYADNVMLLVNRDAYSNKAKGFQFDKANNVCVIIERRNDILQYHSFLSYDAEHCRFDEQ